jgi:hypothetical protein
MKMLFSFTILFFLVTSRQDCSRIKKSGGQVYRGRLEIKGICMNYTIRLLEGNLDSTLISPQWTDETTGKSYTQVFGLGSRCTFPANIEQGDEFSFRIDTAASKQCAVCLAYYPTPAKHLSIICTGQ